MHARVPQVMAKFVVKIEKSSHIIGTVPILEMARSYGLRPRLWPLARTNYYFVGTEQRVWGRFGGVALTAGQEFALSLVG